MLVSISYGSAFLAGLASFLTPCVLPLVPVYLSYLGGVSVGELAQIERHQQPRLWLNGLCFIAGFSTVFIALGASATTFGRFLLIHLDAVERLAGALVLFFGLFLAGLIKLPTLWRTLNIKWFKPRPGIGWGGPWLLGFTFAFGWTPFVGPILGAILALAATKQHIASGITLLALYSLGLALPFILVLLGLQWALPRIKHMQRHAPVIEKISAFGLILLGGAMLLGWFSRLSSLFG